MVYADDEAEPWKIRVGDTVFAPRKRANAPPFDLAYRRLVYSPTRILQPLKRVGFQPGGKSSVENRGRGEFVRISWDEALDIMESELKRVKEQYGNGAILSMSSGHSQNRTVHERSMERLLNFFGGHTPMLRNPDSWEGFWWGGTHVWGFDWNMGQMDQRDLLEDTMQNAKLLIHWGEDALTTMWSNSNDHAQYSQWLNELNTKRIYISPDLNQAAGKYADKWIPIKPGTDAALAAAIAYVWIKEGTYEKGYVHTHGYGFQDWKSYVAGDEDNVPKTPEWAEKITGVKARVIRALAREWASTRTTVATRYGGGACRTPYSHEWARMIIFLQAMQGLGKPGVNIFSVGQSAPLHPEAEGLPSVEVGFVCFEAVADTVPENPVKQCIYQTVLPTAVLKPPARWYGGMFRAGRLSLFGAGLESQFEQGTYPLKGYPEVKMIWMDTVSRITNWNCGHKWIELYKNPKIEFIVAQHPWLEGDALFADLVIPSTTIFEQNDITTLGLMRRGTGHGSSYGNVVSVYMKKCIEPFGEAKSDYDIYLAVSKRLDLEKQFSEGRTVEDWIKRIFEKSSLPKFIKYDEFKKKGYYVFKFPDEWPRSPALRLYHDQPDGNGLKTPSGKIEFYSQNLAKHFPGDRERPPVPHYIAEGPTHQESLSSARAKKYPLLVESPHPRYRFHSRYNSVSWLNELPAYKICKDGLYYEAMWMNPLDARSRGIVENDIVRIFNERGDVFAGAHVTERIIPGTIRIPNGAPPTQWGPIRGYQETGAAINLIAPYNPTSANAFGMAVTAFLAEVEKWNER
jgi:trimethylamine-N-oxide reductase (cytochrome c)